MHWVKDICNDYGLTQYQLSKITGIRQSTLSSSKKRGSRLDSANMMDKLRKAGINPDKYRG